MTELYTLQALLDVSGAVLRIQALASKMDGKAPATEARLANELLHAQAAAHVYGLFTVTVPVVVRPRGGLWNWFRRAVLCWEYRVDYLLAARLRSDYSVVFYGPEESGSLMAARSAHTPIGIGEVVVSWVRARGDDLEGLRASRDPSLNPYYIELVGECLTQVKGEER